MKREHLVSNIISFVVGNGQRSNFERIYSVGTPSCIFIFLLYLLSLIQGRPKWGMFEAKSKVGGIGTLFLPEILPIGRWRMHRDFFYG